MAVALLDLVQHFWISCMIIADFTFYCIEAFSRRLVASLEELAFG